jgi:hypothetical protein
VKEAATVGYKGKGIVRRLKVLLKVEPSNKSNKIHKSFEVGCGKTVKLALLQVAFELVKHVAINDQGVLKPFRGKK